MIGISPTLRQERRVGFLLFLLLLLCFSYTFPRWADVNQNSRLDMIVAIVEDHSFQIDPYVSNTVDYAKVGDHYYSDKAPGAAFLGLPVYAILKPILDLPLLKRLTDWLANNPTFVASLRATGSGVLEQKVRFALALVAITFVVSSLPSALLGLALYRLLYYFTPAIWPRLLVAIGYALFTPAFAYAGAFYGHQLTAALLFGAFYLIFTASGSISTRRLLLTGFLIGYSVATEYPTTLIAGILYLYLLYRMVRWGRWLRFGWAVLTGALVIVGWMIYNTVVFGGPLKLGYSFSEQWLTEHETGFMSLTWPHWKAIWGITFGLFRGLFPLSPLLLLAVPGFILWWRTGKYRAEWWVSFGSILAMFLFNSSSIMWWGGFAVGPRYLLPMLPFMTLPIIFIFIEWRKRLVVHILTAILFLWSWIATWGLTLAEQAFPNNDLHNPLIEYAWPNWLAGNIARNWGTMLKLHGVFSLLPLLLISAALLTGMGWLARSKPSESRIIA